MTDSKLISIVFGIGLLAIAAATVVILKSASRSETTQSAKAPPPTSTAPSRPGAAASGGNRAQVCQLEGQVFVLRNNFKEMPSRGWVVIVPPFISKNEAIGLLNKQKNAWIEIVKDIDPKFDVGIEHGTKRIRDIDATIDALGENVSARELASLLEKYGASLGTVYNYSVRSGQIVPGTSQLSTLAAADAEVNASGKYVLKAPPGEYFLMASMDSDRVTVEWEFPITLDAGTTKKLDLNDTNSTRRTDR